MQQLALVVAVVVIQLREVHMFEVDFQLFACLSKSNAHTHTHRHEHDHVNKNRRRRPSSERTPRRKAPPSESKQKAAMQQRSMGVEEQGSGRAEEQRSTGATEQEAGEQGKK